MKRVFVAAAMAASGLALAAHAEDAQSIWTAQCAKCHGADGKAQTAMGKKLHIRDFTDAQVKAELKDAEMAKAIKDGLKTKEGSTLMKPAEGVADADVTALVALVRGLK